jgi:hypothetical protein
MSAGSRIDLRKHAVHHEFAARGNVFCVGSPLVRLTRNATMAPNGLRVSVGRGAVARAAAGI